MITHNHLPTLNDSEPNAIYQNWLNSQNQQLSNELHYERRTSALLAVLLAICLIIVMAMLVIGVRHV